VIEESLAQGEFLPTSFPTGSKRQTDLAGATLVKLSASKDETSRAIDIVFDWRAAHSYPGDRLRRLLAKHAREQDEHAIVVHRLKRVRSIAVKLMRESWRLTQLQDISGCRAIVSTVDQVDRVVATLQSCSSHSCLQHVDDYILTPKETGYRSVHLIWKFRSKTYPQFDGLLCEMQVRTVLQNIWATTVELCGFLRNEDLKNGIGNEDWLRLFKLVSASFAIQEGRPFLRGVPETQEKIREEARDLIEKLNAISFIHGFRSTIDPSIAPARSAQGQWYLLELDADKKTTKYTSFEVNDFERANAEYKQAELRAKDTPHIHVALVSAYQFEDMQRSYPSFRADVTMFLVLLEYIKNPNTTTEELLAR
jgi:ppGpp synthetase/RelA/SpoT-type nucleotidyltranferase